MNPSILCPVCQNSLSQNGTAFQCENNHTYDLAKEGYLNLLLVNQKSSTNPGDDDGMIIARRNFLNKQYYLNLSDELNKLVKNNSKSKETGSEIKIVDCGCGEGYYLNNLANFLVAENNKPIIYGIDISKTAAKLAAQAFKNAFFIVSNLNYSLPFADNSFDILLNIFAPKNPNEFNRVLTKGGIAIVVFPTRNHLNALKEKLNINIDYDSKPDTVMNSFSKNFKLIDTKQIETTIKLKAADAIELIKMTPIYWQIDQKKIEKLGDVTTEIGFNIYVFKKNR